ncbi:Abi family protein [Collinsella stercoris]|uniref:Abi family protein n=1 Tax=Collinsella stercoris TaxID=147206 RepID=UPI003AEFA72C
MEMKPLKPWLTAEQQVEHLEAEGVQFKMVGHAEAEAYLKRNNNFFRINQFKKGFPQYHGGSHNGEYIRLDFAMLEDLAIIDYEFRQVLLLMTIDVERFAKIGLLSYLERRGEDGYSIVADYLASKDHVGKDRVIVNPVKAEIDRGKEGCYTGALVSAYPAYDFPVWVFLELIPFGVFNQFLLFVAKKHDDK